MFHPECERVLNRNEGGWSVRDFDNVEAVARAMVQNRPTVTERHIVENPNGDNETPPNPSETNPEAHDAPLPGRGVDTDEQPFDVNDPAQSEDDAAAEDEESQQEPLPGRGVDVEDQPFNVNGPAETPTQD